MQLDQTRIAIRERGALDTLDLALHVTRHDFGRLHVSLLLGVLPCALVNYLLTFWMLPGVADDLMDEERLAQLFRFGWTTTLLVFIEAQAASSFVTAFLGQAVFLDAPSIRDVVRDVAQQWRQLLWCEFTLRGILAAWILVLLADRAEAYSPAEALLVMLVLLLVFVRALRPHLHEVVILERNPLRSPDPLGITVGRRNAMLHAGGTVGRHWAATALAAMLLVMSLVGTMVFLAGAFLNRWAPGLALFAVIYVVALWLVVGYVAVVRFLGYLDLRIRQEGWEVELRLRAEATRMSGHLT